MVANAYKKATYYTGLNVWRAGMMMLGVLVHAVGMPAPGAWHSAAVTIQAASHLFRMEAFFAISGFLAWRSSGKHGHLFARMRIVQLALPLLTTYFLILPPALPVVQSIYGEVAPGELMHLWFLVTLIAIVIIMDEVGRRSRILPGLAAALQARPLSVVLGLTIAAMVMLVLGASLMRSVSYEPYAVAAHSFAFALLRAPYFLIYYLLGFSIAQTNVLIEKQEVLRVIGSIGALMLISVVVIVACSGDFFNGSARPPSTKLIAHLIVPFIAMPVSMLILQTGVSVNAGNAVTEWFARSAFTVYLCHYTALYLAYGAAVYLAIPQPTSAIIVMASGFVAPLAFHFLIVQHSSYLRLILNGSFSISPVARPSLNDSPAN